MHTKFLSLFLTLGIILFTVPGASAQDVSADDQALMRQAYQEIRDAQATGNYDLAISKMDAAYALYENLFNTKYSSNAGLFKDIANLSYEKGELAYDNHHNATARQAYEKAFNLFSQLDKAVGPDLDNKFRMFVILLHFSEMSKQEGKLAEAKEYLRNAGGTWAF